ncbi:MAG: histidine kinase [Bacteroidota bacterium]
MEEILRKGLIGAPGLSIKNLSKLSIDLRVKINVILPIALAVIIPGLVVYVNSAALNLPNKLRYISMWGFGSLVMYTLWQVLWHLWEIRTAKGRKALVISFLMLCLVLTVKTIVEKTIVDTTQYAIESTTVSLLRLTLACVLVLAVQFALRAQQNISKLKLEKEQIQTENYRVQLQALRSQIDPHFLFNSLNTLRSMVRQQHTNSEQFVMSLSQFYRQTLKHNENTTLPLSEELAVLESYLFLMKSRNEEAVSIHIDIDKESQTHHIPTLALQVVVENCFKHNSMTSKNPLKIEISNMSKDYIQVKNNIQPKFGDNEPSGFGLDSLKKRYELMDVQRGVEVEETEDVFSVRLKLIEKR